MSIVHETAADNPTRCPGYKRMCNYAKDEHAKLCPHCQARLDGDNWIREQRKRDRKAGRPVSRVRYYIALLEERVGRSA